MFARAYCVVVAPAQPGVNGRREAESFIRLDALRLRLAARQDKD
jgi:hypothetical protein